MPQPATLRSPPYGHHPRIVRRYGGRPLPQSVPVLERPFEVVRDVPIFRFECPERCREALGQSYLRRSSESPKSSDRPPVMPESIRGCATRDGLLIPARDPAVARLLRLRGRMSPRRPLLRREITPALGGVRCPPISRRTPVAITPGLVTLVISTFLPNALPNSSRP